MQARAKRSEWARSRANGYYDQRTSADMSYVLKRSGHVLLRRSEMRAITAKRSAPQYAQQVRTRPRFRIAMRKQGNFVILSWEDWALQAAPRERAQFDAALISRRLHLRSSRRWLASDFGLRMRACPRATRTAEGRRAPARRGTRSIHVERAQDGSVAARGLAKLPRCRLVRGAPLSFQPSNCTERLQDRFLSQSPLRAQQRPPSPQTARKSKIQYG